MIIGVILLKFVYEFLYTQMIKGQFKDMTSLNNLHNALYFKFLKYSLLGFQ